MQILAPGCIFYIVINYLTHCNTAYMLKIC